MSRALQGVVCFVVIALAAACGGPPHAPDFNLRDDGGRSWTLSQQRGKMVFLTFGFTHCLDTCPLTLAKLARVGESLNRRGDQTEVVFVTIDPRRDTVPVMHRFIGRFSSAQSPVVGLTGTPAAIDGVKAAYHVWSAPIAHDIAHTAVIFFIDSSGRLAGAHDDDESEASLAQIAETLAAR